MKYSLDCHIITNNNGIRNAVKQLIPSIDDSRIWGEEYEYYEKPNEDGVMIFSCRIRFHIKTERSAITSSVHGLQGILMACENESFVREHKCFHDETPKKPCEQENVIRKKDGEIIWR